MSNSNQYGLEQARSQLPLIAAEAQAGYTSVITRHGKAVAVVVPVAQWQAEQAKKASAGDILALRGSGRELWPQAAAQTVSELRDEWGG